MAPEVQNHGSSRSSGKPGVPARDTVPAEPSRGYFFLKEACEITDIQPYVLRFWESEFPQLAGKKRGRQLTYTRDDIALILQIKQLLHNEEFTLADARERLEHGEKAGKLPEEPAGEERDAASLQEEVESLQERLADIRGRYDAATLEIAHLNTKLAAAEDRRDRSAKRLQVIRRAFREMTGLPS